MKIQAVADYQCTCGENPLWHADENRVYWTDIDTGRLFRYDPASGKHEQIYAGRKVGGFTFQADGSLLLFMDRGTVAEFRDGKITRTIVEDIPDERETRFNDVIADPEGRVFCGTMPTKERLGRLYRLDRDGKVHLILEGIACPNGMGFTRDLEQMYFTDATIFKIHRFDYDRKTGKLSNQMLFLQTPPDAGYPDGMTVDDQQNIWSAKWDGHALEQYSPEAKLLRKIPFPSAKRVSSLTFGGDDLSTMYVTTAGGEDRKTCGADAGALFRVEGSGARGVAEFCSRIRL